MNPDAQIIYDLCRAYKSVALQDWGSVPNSVDDPEYSKAMELANRLNAEHRQLRLRLLTTLKRRLEPTAMSGSVAAVWPS